MANQRKRSQRRNALVPWQSMAAAEKGRQRNKQRNKERKRHMSEKGRERARRAARPDEPGMALARASGGKDA